MRGYELSYLAPFSKVKANRPDWCIDNDAREAESNMEAKVCKSAEIVAQDVAALRDAIFARISALERNVYELNKEILSLRADKKKVVMIDPSLRAFAQHQSIEVLHPCFQKVSLCTDGETSGNPNNVMCFTPTTLNMFVGTPTQAPLFSIQPIRTQPEPHIVEVDGKLERRFCVDILVEFQSVEAESFFTGILKDGSSKITPTEYETYVLVHEPKEFVNFLTQRYLKTLERWSATS